MAALTHQLERRAPATAYVALIADGPARVPYEKFGFADTATHGDRDVPRDGRLNWP